MTLFEAQALAAQLGPSEELIVDGDEGAVRLVLNMPEGGELPIQGVPGGWHSLDD